MRYLVSKLGSDTRQSMPELKRLVRRSSMPSFLGARSLAMTIFLFSRMNSSTSWKKNSMEAWRPMMFWISSMISTSAVRYSRMIGSPGPRWAPRSRM